MGNDCTVYPYNKILRISIIHSSVKTPIDYFLTDSPLCGLSTKKISMPSCIARHMRVSFTNMCSAFHERHGKIEEEAK